jgi:hypothetical protein
MCFTGHQLAVKAQAFDWKGGIGVYPNIPNLLHLDIASPRVWGWTPDRALMEMEETHEDEEV